METERLRLLIELERLGSMRAVADELQTTTSRVSNQLALLSTEMGIALLEPAGRNVRLTAAGRRVVDRGRIVLAELEAARADEAGSSTPTGTVHVVAFATAIRSALIPAMRRLQHQHPDMRVTVTEHEPDDARALLLADGADLALLYDYNLAPIEVDPALETMPLWTTRWCLGVNADEPDVAGSANDVFTRFRTASWIGNSRNTADERAIATLASIAGFSPQITHRCDDLDSVTDLIAAGEGIALLPANRPAPHGVRLVPLDDPPIVLRASASHRAGRNLWPPLRAILRELHTGQARDAIGASG